jgi:ETC complex I subunit conserved region
MRSRSLHPAEDEHTATGQIVPGAMGGGGRYAEYSAKLIYRPARSAMTSGKARTREWKLRFEPRMPRYIEPLMGWTEHDDTLAEVELSFPSMEAAVAYARRGGLHYVVQGLTDVGTNIYRIGYLETGHPKEVAIDRATAAARMDRADARP